MLSDSTGKTALRIGHGETCCYVQHAILIRRKNMALTQEDLQQIVDAVNQSKGNDVPDLPAFKESSFYTTWSSAFHSLGLTGVIAIPNTTFNEWLYWFQEWGKAFSKNYNDFKDLVNQTFTELNEDIATINADLITLHQKDAEIEKEINDKISGIISPNVIDNLATLKEKYPNGANGIWVSAEDGHKYGWVNNTWTDLGVYQSVIIPDGSITNDKFAKEKDIFKSLTIIPNKYIATSGATVSYINSPNFFVIKIPVTKGKLRLNLLTTGGVYVTTTTSDGNTVVWQKSYTDFIDPTKFSRWGYSVNSTDWIVDFDIISIQTTEKYLYITQPIENMSTQHVYQTLAETINESIPYLDYDNVDNETISQLGDQNMNLKMTPFYRQRITSFNTDTGAVISVESNSHAYFNLKLPASGKIQLPKTNLTTGQFILVVDDQKRVIQNYGYQYLNGTSNKFIYEKDNKIEIDVDAMRANFDVEITEINIVMYQDDIINFSPLLISTEKITHTLKYVDTSISHDDFKDTTNILGQLEILPNQYVAQGTDTILFTPSDNFYVVKIPILKKGVMTLPMIKTGGQYLTAVLPDQKTLAWQKTYEQLFTSFNRGGFSVTQKEVTIDLNFSGNQLEEKYIYVTQAYENKDSFYVRLKKEISTENLLNSTDTTNITNRSLTELSNEFTPLNIEMLYRRRNTSYNTATGEIKFSLSNQHATAYLTQIPTTGIMDLGVSTVTSGQYVILTDANGKALVNYGYQFAQGTSRNPSLYLQDGHVYFNFYEALKLRPNVAGLQITLFNGDIENFKPTFTKTNTLTDVFKWALVENSNNKNNNLMLTKNYNVLIGKTANLVLDQLLINGSIYDDKTAIASKSLGTQKIGLVDVNDVSIGVKSSYESPYVNINVRRVDSKTNLGSKTVMVIGESTSESSYMLKPLTANLTSDATSFTLVGTRTQGAINHEARSGWGVGAVHFAKTANGITNSFFNPDKGEFDWDWYLNKYNIDAPDVVLLNFGLNAVNKYVENITNLTQSQHFDFIINQIKKTRPDTKIIIGVTPKYSSFGNFRNDSLRDDISNLMLKTITDYDGRENENIYLAPYYYNVDTLWDMQYTQIPANEYQPTDRVDYIGSDHFHPSAIGYHKLSNVMYATIKFSLS